MENNSSIPVFTLHPPELEYAERATAWAKRQGYQPIERELPLSRPNTLELDHAQTLELALCLIYYIDINHRDHYPVEQCVYLLERINEHIAKLYFASANVSEVRIEWGFDRVDGSPKLSFAELEALR